jgi:hypothetical protein
MEAKVMEKIIVNETPERLQEAYNFVRRVFFPKWDRTGKWQIRYISGPYYMGRCNHGLNTIDIRFLSDDDIELYLLLTHEICHTSALSHEIKWQDRMIRAGNRIKKLGYDPLAREVINEVERFRGSPAINAKFIYRSIAKIVMDNKNVSFENVMVDLSREYYGGDSVPYKHCREAYDRAISYRERKDKI